ncbi:hypothetical protein IIA79_03690 [bacterium]|nr:hypothetical protein [bacterium]
MNLPVEWSVVKIAALVALVVYFAVVLVFYGREVRFLASVKAPRRRAFIVQNILIQLCILAVLLPCAAAPQPTPTLLKIVMTGFVSLWVVTIWMSVSRYMYTYHVLLSTREEMTKIKQKLEEIKLGIEQEEPEDEARD